MRTFLLGLTPTQKGILYMLGSSFLFALMGVGVKGLSETMSSVQIVFLRNFFGIFFILSTVFHSPMNNRGGRPYLLFFRGFIGATALMMFFYNIVHLSLAKAMVFSQTSPIFTTILGFVIFKERLSLKAVFGVLVGFVGVLFVSEVGTTFSKMDYLGIVGGMLAAVAYSSVKELRGYYDSRLIVLSFMLLGSLFPGLSMLYYQWFPVYQEDLDFIFAPFVLPEGLDWWYIFVVVATSSTAQVLLTKSYGYIKAGIAATISYSTIAFSVMFGFLIGEGLPNWSLCVGILFIVCSGILVTRKR